MLSLVRCLLQVKQNKTNIMKKLVLCIDNKYFGSNNIIICNSIEEAEEIKKNVELRYNTVIIVDAPVEL